MFFSIIIPTFNRAEIIQKTVASVIGQTFGDFEVIVVDDGSTDGTRNIIADLNNEKIKYYYKKNEERAVARNYGADRAKGKFLIFLDSDDQMRDDHLQRIHACVSQTNPEAPFLFTGYTILDPGGRTVYEYGQTGIFDRRKLFYGNFLGCSAVVIRRDVFQQYQFNTYRDLILFEDWELWLRVIATHPLTCLGGKSILMVNHKERSVLRADHHSLIEKTRFLKKTVFANVREISGSYVNRRIFLMGIYSYTSLHVAMSKTKRLVAIQYLLKSLYSNPFFIFKRRFFGILKNLI